MKKILLIMMIICLSAGVVYAEPTVKEILQKKLANDQALQTFEAKVTTVWEIPSKGISNTKTGYNWIRGDQESRLEIYENDGSLFQVHVSSGLNTAIINKNGEIYEVDKSTNTETGEVDLSSYDIDKLLEYFDMNINSAKSVGQVYCIEASPKNNSTFYEGMGKSELYIDYDKGYEVKDVFYDKSGSQIGEVQFSDLEQIDGIWIAKKKVTKGMVENNEIINTITFNEIKVNQSINDDKFKIPEGT